VLRSALFQILSAWVGRWSGCKQALRKRGRDVCGSTPPGCCLHSSSGIGGLGECRISFPDSRRLCIKERVSPRLSSAKMSADAPSLFWAVNPHLTRRHFHARLSLADRGENRVGSSASTRQGLTTSATDIEVAWGQEIATYGTSLAHANSSVRDSTARYTDPETGQHWLFWNTWMAVWGSGKLNTPWRWADSRWIAQFHVDQSAPPEQRTPPLLKRYDKEYYLGWISRTVDFAGPELQEIILVSPSQCACRGVPVLRCWTQHRPIIHGEYYQHNILFHRGESVDRLGIRCRRRGVIDLACLTDGWKARSLMLHGNLCPTRWPKGAPTSFQRVFQAARLYMTARWLGDDPDVTRSGGCAVGKLGAAT